MFYQLDQNNSYGYFDVDDKVCHRLFIEADSLGEAKLKAEELGCYWDGVVNGIDCACCGDRWDEIEDVNFKKLKAYTVTDVRSKSSWLKKCGKYEIVENPTLDCNFLDVWRGKISFSTVEEYAQYLADNYGWTEPDARIYYKDGTVKEIYKER